MLFPADVAKNATNRWRADDDEDETWGLWTPEGKLTQKKLEKNDERKEEESDDEEALNEKLRTFLRRYPVSRRIEKKVYGYAKEIQRCLVADFRPPREHEANYSALAKRFVGDIEGRVGRRAGSSSSQKPSGLSEATQAMLRERFGGAGEKKEQEAAEAEVMEQEAAEAEVMEAAPAHVAGEWKKRSSLKKEGSAPTATSRRVRTDGRVTTTVVANFKEMGEAIWFYCPGCQIACEKCDRVVDASAGRLHGDVKRSRFA